MILLLLFFYIIPFLTCCVVGYHFSIKNKETWGQYLTGVLTCLLPMFNLILAIWMMATFCANTQTGKSLINNITTFLDKPVK